MESSFYMRLASGRRAKQDESVTICPSGRLLIYLKSTLDILRPMVLWPVRLDPLRTVATVLQTLMVGLRDFGESFPSNRKKPLALSSDLYDEGDKLRCWKAY